MFFVLFWHVPLLNLFCQTCWKFPVNETFAFDFSVEAPTTTTKVLLSTVYISISFPFIWCLSTLYFLEILCYINWYAKINTLNACNHLATSYSHIPKTCAFDYYTNTCINISTFLEQFCLWSKLFFLLNAPIQKFMHDFHFFSGIWSNPLYTCKHTYERYKFHVEPLTVIYL